MKKITSLLPMLLLFVVAFLSSCQKENVSMESTLSLKDITNQTLESFDWENVDQNKVEENAYKIWAQLEDGRLLSSELMQVGNQEDPEVEAAAIVALSLSKDEYEYNKAFEADLVEEYDGEPSSDDELESRGSIYYKWTGGTPTSYWWFGIKYKYPCTKHTGWSTSHVCNSYSTYSGTYKKKCHQIDCNIPSGC